MAIVKLPNSKYQVKVKGADGKWNTKCFTSHRDARQFEAELRDKSKFCSNMGVAHRVTVTQYFDEWFGTRENQTSLGWRREQLRNFRKFVEPKIGHLKLDKVSPGMVGDVFVSMSREGKAEQTRLHVFNLLRKMFRDAIEIFQLLSFNPVLLGFKPKIPMKEARYLNIDEIRALLVYSKNRPYGVAIWLQLFLGLRVGEVQALRWSDLDLNVGVCRIHRTFVRKDRLFKNYPKGRKQHSKRVPEELKTFLAGEKEKSQTEFVVTRKDGSMLHYDWYNQVVKKYCKDLGITVLGTHGLRHSTAALYLKNGATKDDLCSLFAHSSSSVTERYIHGQGTNLEKVAMSLQVFD